jgi:phosphopantetheine adenylyltransferase
MIKELHSYGGDISPYVPTAVLHKMREKVPVSGRERG